MHWSRSLYIPNSLSNATITRMSHLSYKSREHNVPGFSFMRVMGVVFELHNGIKILLISIVTL